MTEKGYVFFSLRDEGRFLLQQEKADWIPQIEGVTTELLAGPFDGVFTIEAPDMHSLGEIIVNLIANVPSLSSRFSGIVIRDYGAALPNPEEGG